uniref:ankyrin repeat domain-containing protein SOWAHA-like n=1 Tax=Myxine glutinosa TaxID=7769 RepID=UPI00358F89F4
MDTRQEALITLLRRAGGKMCSAELIQAFKKLPTEPEGRVVTLGTLKGLISLVAFVHLEGEEQMVVLKNKWAEQKCLTDLCPCSNEILSSSQSQLGMSTSLDVHAEAVPINLSLDQWEIQTISNINLDSMDQSSCHGIEDETMVPGESRSIIMAGPAEPKLEYDSRTEDINCMELMNSGYAGGLSGDDVETELTWNSNDVKRDMDVEEKNDFWVRGPFLPTACSQECKSESRCSLDRSRSSCSEIYIGKKVNLVNRGSSLPRQLRRMTSPCFSFDLQRRLATKSVLGDEEISSSSWSLRRPSCSCKRRSQGSSASSSWWLWGSVHAIAAAEQHWLLEVANGHWLSLKDIVKVEPGLCRHRDPVTGYTALHWAAKRGETQAVLQLLNDRSGTPEDVDAPARGTGYTALHLAALHGHLEVLKMLVGAFGANTEVRDHSGKKPWQYLPSDLSDSLHELLGAPDSYLKGAPSFKDNWLRGRWLFNKSPSMHQVCEGRLSSALHGAGTRKNVYQELCSTKLARAWFRMSGQSSPISNEARRRPVLRTRSNF